MDTQTESKQLLAICCRTIRGLFTLIDFIKENIHLNTQVIHILLILNWSICASLKKGINWDFKDDCVPFNFQKLFKVKVMNSIDVMNALKTISYDHVSITCMYVSRWARLVASPESLKSTFGMTLIFDFI